MRFAVSVRGQGVNEESVLVDAAAHSAVGSLGTAIVASLGLEDEVRLHHQGQVLDPALTVAAAGLRDGSVLGLDEQVTRPTAPVSALVDLRVVAGPGSGMAYSLQLGHYLLGADPEKVDIHLSDAGAPRPAMRITVQYDGTVVVADPAGQARLMEGHTTSERIATGIEWPYGVQLLVGQNLLEIARPSRSERVTTPAEDGIGLEFNRPPRFVPPVAPTTFRLPSRPGPAPQSKLPLLPIVLTPVLGSIIGVLVTGNWRLIFLGLVSPIAALLTRSSGSRRAAADHARKVRVYDETVARVRSDVRDAVITEQDALRQANPDPAALRRFAVDHADRLWERRRLDPDFLRLRVGTGSVPSQVKVEDPSEDEHRRTSRQSLENVPAVVDLAGAGVVGAAGSPQTARWLTAQAAVLHSPTDLTITVLSSRPDVEGERLWGWCRWLPHCQAGGERAWVRIGTSTETVARRISELSTLMAERSERRKNRSDQDAARNEPALLVVIDQARRLRSLPGVISLLRDGPALGIYTICIDDEERQLPEESRAVVRSVEGGGIAISADEAPSAVLRADLPDDEWYDAVSRSISGLRPIADGDLAVLPGAVRMLALLDLDHDAPERIASGWVLAPRSTSAVLGVGLDGPFSVDIVRDGPHGLIAGTTGSGKSELLQTLVASLAVVNRPDEMTFVLVDYKGGSAFAECAELPHTVGLVTDLDTHLVERALVSLQAELRRREHLLADTGAKDISDYITRRTSDSTMPALPRLLIVVDEFASMIRELPDFVTGLVNIAQRGRSLGLHLILATQRPSGAVTADISANTNLRIALRTTDPSESRDIIDAPDAADIATSTPGRAYVRLSHSALLPFQSARVGGRAPAKDVAPAAQQQRVAVTPLGWNDLGAPVSSAAHGDHEGASEEAAHTDLASLVGAVRKATEHVEISAVTKPWLPALPLICTLGREPLVVARSTSAPGLPPVPWGVVDLPAAQTQQPLLFDTERAGHVHVIGAAQSGRSQALRTLAAALAEQHGPGDVHLYGIDCGNGGLLALSQLPHCGAVVDHKDPERLGRLLDRLVHEVTRRQAMLGSHGVSSLTELRSRGDGSEKPPHIIVLVDRFEVFDRDFSQYDNGSFVDRVAALLRDGGGVGIHFVLTGDRLLMSTRYASTTEDKLVLRLNDPSDWSTVGVRSKDVPENMPPGRALRPRDGAEVQLAVLDALGVTQDQGSSQVSGGAQASALAALAGRLRARHEDIDAQLLPSPVAALPDGVTYAQARSSGPPSGGFTAVVGVGGDDLRGLGPDFSYSSTFVIGGPPRSGRSTALLTVAASLLAGGTGLVVLAPRRSPMRDLVGHPLVAAVITDAKPKAQQLREALQQVPQDTGAVLVDDAELIARADVAEDLAALARGAAGEGWAFVVGGNSEALSAVGGGFMPVVRRNRSGLLLSPQSMAESDLVGVRISRGLIGGAAIPGRGHLHLGDGVLTTVQVPATAPADVMDRGDAAGPYDKGNQEPPELREQS